MNKKALIILTATVMILSSFAVALNNPSVQTYASQHNLPYSGSSSTAHLGNVTIYANGTVSNTSVIQQTGNTYSLLMDINGTLSDQRNGSYLDGKGFVVNGLGGIGVNFTYVYGVTLMNIVIVNSTIGVNLFAGSYATLVNLSISDPSLSETMIDVEYSSNVSIQGSNFSMNATVNTGSYGVYAYEVTSLNVTGNQFSGSTSDYFVFGDYVGTFSAWNNTMLGTQGTGSGFYFDYTGYTSFGHNYVNNTYYGIYVYWTQSEWSSQNVIHNTTEALVGEYLSLMTSIHDNLTLNSYGVYSTYNANVMILYDNISNQTVYSVYGYYTVNLTVVGSNLSYDSSDSVLVEYGGNVNLLNDVMRYSSSSTTEAVYVEYTSGWVNLVGDYINISGGTGIYMYYASYINVTNSYIKATYNIYFYEYIPILGATISNNTFVTMGGEYTIYNYYPYYADNIVMTNNFITSPSSSWSYSVLYIDYAYYGSNNIVFDNNTVHNSIHPVYVYTYYEYNYGQNVYVQNNTFVNTTDAVNIYYYYHSVVTGNTLINTSTNGIYVYNGEAGYANISNNYIVNMPGFGSMSDYAITEYYLYSGNNIISHNYISVGAAYGIYVYESVNVQVFDNVVMNASYAYYLYYNNVVSVFNNTALNSDYGLYSEDNNNIQYYSNNFTNDNKSLYSTSDYTGSVFANTFYDSQSNMQSLYFVNVSSYAGLTFYHNNFINATTNSNVSNSITSPLGPIAFNASLPVGGNYWSNYTGSALNGIGTTPMNVYGNVTDYYPLAFKWINPTVTFIETGLPSGTSWTVSLGSSMQTAMASSIVYSTTNGEHTNVTYSVSHVSGYVASVTSGNVYLNGADKVVMVSFTPYTYNVTFTPSNLPAGTTWSVTFDGTTVTTNALSMTFTEPNGTYNYTVGPVKGYSTASSGSVTVSSGTQSVALPFSKTLYTVTVNEKGLPSGDTWTYTFNGTAHTSTSNVVTFQATFGTFGASATGPSGYNVSTASSVTVNYANTSANVTFSVIPAAPPVPVYTVLVTENGLASGSSWTFVLNGKSYTTNLSALVVHVVAGTYSMNASGPSGYTVSLKASSVTVSGNTTVTVDFSSGTHTSGSGALLYEGLGAGVAIGAVVAAFATMFATGSGVFRNVKKGKGEN